MKIRAILLFLVLLESLFAEKPVSENPVEIENSKEKAVNAINPEIHIHDDFYFRFFNNLAVGYGGVWQVSQNSSIDISNLSNSGSVQFGYSFALNWIPFLSFDYNVTPYHISILSLFPGNVPGLGFPDNPEHALIMSYSLGLTHYFMPQNYYVSFSVGLSQAAVLNDADPANIETSETDFGVSFKLAVGKEWWVSANWGLGVAVYTEYNYFGETKSGPLVTPLNAFTIGIAASATFN